MKNPSVNVIGSKLDATTSETKIEMRRQNIGRGNTSFKRGRLTIAASRYTTSRHLGIHIYRYTVNNKEREC